MINLTQYVQGNLVTHVSKIVFSYTGCN